MIKKYSSQNIFNSILSYELFGIKLIIKIINSSKVSDGIYEVQFVPFNISTLKIQVNNNENELLNVKIYPLSLFNTDDYCGGYDDNQKGIKIIWGSGFEDGVVTVLDSWTI